jgi:hypothetical protein
MSSLFASGTWRPFRSRRALLALIPVLALAAAAAVPAGAEVDPGAPPVTEPAPAVVEPAPPVVEPAPPVVEPAPPAAEPTPAPTALPAAAAAPLVAASAASSPSTSALQSWGTARSSGKSKAQRVNAVVEMGGVAYFGGEFSKMVGPGGATASRSYLAAVNGSNGSLTGWNPKASGKVWALELSADGGSVYVGGDFSKIGGVSVSKVAKVSLATGKVDPTFKPRSVSGRVRALALDGDRLYIGGEFGSVAGVSRPKLAVVDARTGALSGWTPPPLGPGRFIGHTGIPTPDYSPGHVFAIKVIGGKVFIGGNFLDFGGNDGIVTLDAASGGLVEPQYDLRRPVFDLDSSGGRLFAVSGGPGGRVYGLDPNNAKPLWNAHFDGDAVGVAASGTTVYVAGHYDYIVSKKSSCYQFCPGGPRRHHLSAFSTDGTLLSWNPDADTSTGPFTVAVGADALYVGGEFNKINFKSQPGFVIFPGRP